MDRGRVVSVIDLVISALLVLYGVCGMIKGISYFCQRNTGATFLAAQLVFYSGVSVFMGWHQFKSRGRNNWRRSGDTWRRSKSEEPDEREEQEKGWKQQKP